MTKVYLSAGHGGADPGAVAFGFQYREKDLTLMVTKDINYFLNKYFVVDTKMARSSDRTLNLRTRTDEANAWGANYFVDVHVNAGGGTGYEDYIHISLSDSSTTARYRDAVHKEIAHILQQWGVANRGKKKANFHVLRETRMSAILTESLFIDNVSDQALLSNPTFLRDMAEAHAKGIGNALNLARKTVPATNVKPNDRDESLIALRRVVVDGTQIGAWGNKSYLLRAVEKAVSGGAEEVRIERV